ncbi:MAG: ABC transporter ATP-binding protein [Planctomycetota bacterium]|jgi:oligopeptide/dipeptide ABC transporter ATP-binding protein|nr:ABC transporter ATP-binding protein [Planctomycetota bacterium]
MDSTKTAGDGRSPRLAVEGLSVAFDQGGREALAVEDVSFRVERGETLALVGESGCGKSVTCMAVMRLLATPPARIVSGKVLLSGKDVMPLGNGEMRRIRGKRMAMIFQEPMTSFDPVYTIGYQLVEAVLTHEAIDPAEAALRAQAVMRDVGLADPAGLMRRYPHELSGGMKQRAMIAMALVENPEIILCDEPTTALDVTIQAQIMDLLAKLRDERGVSLLFITHNLGLVAGFAHRAAVMYSGRIIETADVEALYANPLHPYTIGLFASVPRLDQDGGRLPSIPGSVPSLPERPVGCKFWPRCDRARDVCREEDPPLEDKGRGHFCACRLVAREGGA